MAAWPAAPLTIPTYYIRHGQSQWNAVQTAARLEGRSEAEVKAMGDDEAHTDSPLSALGVRQGLTLQRQLFHAVAPPSDDCPCSSAIPCNRSLALALSCAFAEPRLPPVLFTSNLRRAADTTLLAMRPVVEGSSGLDVLVLPALQETCSHADCMPLPQQPSSAATGRSPLQPPDEIDESADTAHGNGVRRTVFTAQRDARVQAEAELEAEREAAVASGAPSPGADTHSGFAPFLDEAYRTRLALHPVPYDVWDDRRNLMGGTAPSAADWKRLHARGSRGEANRLRPFLARTADVLDRMIVSARQAQTPAAVEAAAASAAAGEGGGGGGGAVLPPVVIGAHSRMLRELLYVFLRGQSEVTLRHAPPQPTTVALAWDAANNAPECAQLAGELTRMANAGVLAFDLRLAPTGRARSLPTLTLTNCRLAEGAAVLPRKPKGAPAVEASSSSVLSTVAGLAGLSDVGASQLLLAGVFVVGMRLARMWFGRRAAAKRAGEEKRSD